MKNIFRKNQVIITALAIMIAVAGYLNFTKDNIDGTQVADSIATSSDAAYDITENGNQDASIDFGEIETDGTMDISQADDMTIDTAENETKKDSKKETKKESKKESKKETKEDTEKKDSEAAETAKQIEVSDSGELAANTDNEGTPGEAVLANSSISSGFFSAAKLTREQTRAKNKETLMEVVNNTNATEKQRQQAIDNIINLTSVSEKETAAEILLEAKGFEGSVVNIVDGSVDVVVNSESISEQKLAQIEDIVKGKTGITAEHITITPVDAK